MPSPPRKPSSTEATESLRVALQARAALQSKLREHEPDWTTLTSRLRLDAAAEARLLVDLRRVWLLPFINVEAAVDLLVFQQARLPALKAGFEADANTRGRRLARLFDLLMLLSLQASSMFPQNTLHLARLAQQSLETGQVGDDRLEPLLDLLVQSDGGDWRDGRNAFRLADANGVVVSEYERSLGITEPIWKTPNKFEDYHRELVESKDFQADWSAIVRSFPLDRFRDSAGIVRRSPLPERSWQPPAYPDLRTTRDQFQVCFDVFCWKWFLYGMRQDDPLVDKLSVTFTRFGTQVFVPGYWSLDPTRDLDWGRILQLHRARVVPKQGAKLATGREQRQQQLRRLVAADAIARARNLRGPARYQFLKQQAGLTDQTDDRQVRRLLQSARSRVPRRPA